MDEHLRQLERGDDPQALFDALRRAGKYDDALALVESYSIRTTVTLEYWYSYRFLRSNGFWHSHPDYLAKTYEDLAPIVAETIRNGYIARSMEITGDHWQRRGQLILIPVMLLGDNPVKLPCDSRPFRVQIVRDTDEFRRFMRLVIQHRQAGGKTVPKIVSDRYRQGLGGEIELLGGKGSHEDPLHIETGVGGTNV